MDKIINILLMLLLLGSCIFNVVLVNRLDESINVILETKLTDIEPEIIFLDSLVYDTVYVESKEFIKLPIVDTLVLTDTIVAVDSIEVELPIEVKHFSDTLHNVGISLKTKGFKCEIDNLYVKNFLSVPTQEKAVNKWYDNLGFGIGLGITYIERFRVISSVGIYYKLF